MSELVDTEVVALLAKVSASTVRNWSASGVLTRVERDPDGRNLFELDAVLALISARQPHSHVLDDLLADAFDRGWVAGSEGITGNPYRKGKTP